MSYMKNKVAKLMPNVEYANELLEKHKQFDLMDDFSKKDMVNSMVSMIESLPALCRAVLERERMYTNYYALIEIGAERASQEAKGYAKMNEKLERDNKELRAKLEALESERAA